MANPEHVWRLNRGAQNWNAWRREHERVCPDLSGADLSRRNVGRRSLSGADLQGVDLSGADLSSSYLYGADLNGADLSNAGLREVELNGANLSSADLRGADLSGADLSRAAFRGAKLVQAKLVEAKLIEADLGGANLNSASLNGADLRGANLSHATLHGVDLSRTDLRGTTLDGARFDTAAVRQANLTTDQIERVIGFSLDLSQYSIRREIEFPAELRDAGLSVLNYFHAYLTDKYPDDQVAVRIRQDGRMVRLEIDPPDGKKEVVETELAEYGLVVAGQKDPAEILDDAFQIQRLKNHLSIARAQHEATKELLAIQEKNADRVARIAEAAVSARGDVSFERLQTLLSVALGKRDSPPSAPQTINIHVQGGKAEATANASTELIDSETPKLIAELSEQLKGDALSRAANSIRRLSQQVKLPVRERRPREELETEFLSLEQMAQVTGIAGAAASVASAWHTWAPTVRAALGL